MARMDQEKKRLIGQRVSGEGECWRDRVGS
jgi:hypothetical protein